MNAIAKAICQPLRLLIPILFLNVGQLVAQSDRPCDAFNMNVSDCNAQNIIVLAGSAFQAADGSIPVACDLPYTHDVWVQVVAPSSNPVVSVGTWRNMAFGGAVDPTQIHALFYQGSPDCNNLINVGGCPTLCSIGVVCIDLDDNTGHGMAWRFSGLTAGNNYFLRILWNPNPNPAFDTVRVTLFANPCIPCDPCGGGAVVLDAAQSQLQASWDDGRVALQWLPEGAVYGDHEVLRSTDAQNWEPTDARLDLAKGGFVGLDQPPYSESGLYYQVRHSGVNGEQKLSNIARVHTRPGTWLRGQTWEAEHLLLHVDFESATRLQISDLQGRRLHLSAVEPGAQTLRIPRAALGSGMLLLQPLNAEGLHVERLVAGGR